MRPRHALSLVSPLLLFGLAACFEGPEAVDRQPSAQANPQGASAPREMPAGHPPVDQQLPEGHPPLGGAEPGQGAMPPGHPPMGGNAEASDEPLIGGELELRGDLARVSDGAVFVLARVPGQRMPLMVRKVDLTGAQPAAPGAARVVEFALSEQDTMLPGAQIPADVELEVFYAPDGTVDGPKEERISTTVPAKKGDVELKVTLEG